MLDELSIEDELSALELIALGAIELELGAVFATGSLAAELVAIALELVGVLATGSLAAGSFWAVLPWHISLCN